MEKESPPSRRTVCLEAIQVLGKGFLSPDRATRWMTGILVLSVVGLFSVMALAVKRQWSSYQSARLRQEEYQSQVQREADERTAADLWEKQSRVSLGSFTLELKIEENQHKRMTGVVHLAELEIVLICSNLKVKEYIEDNKVRARDVLTGVLTAYERQELLSREGKNQLKVKLLKAINEWLKEGKIIGIDIPEFIVN